LGVDLLRQQNHSSYAPYVKKRTSPVLSTLLSFICPGLGAAYNGQTVKALVHFGLFVGLFQMAVLTGGTLIFVLGFMGMWCFAALDAWRTAQMIRSGVTPDVAEDILVKRFSGNPKLWGVLLAVLGSAFLLQSFFNLRFLMRGLLPIGLIGLGIYLLRGYIFRPKVEPAYSGYTGRPSTAEFMLSEPTYARRNYDSESRFSNESRGGAWRDR